MSINGRSNQNLKLFLQLLLIFAVSRGVIIGVYFVYKYAFGDTGGFSDIFGRWDSVFYERITTKLYTWPVPGDPQADWAFFPLYPLLCRGIMIITFWKLPVFYVCSVVSNVCIFTASFFAVKLVRFTGMTSGENDDSYFKGFAKDGLMVAWLLMLAPYTVYFATAYTESLFVMLVVLSFYFMKRNLFLAAGVTAALAGATRSTGVVLIVPLIMEMYRRYKEEKSEGEQKSLFIGDIIKKPFRLLSLVIVPAGIFTYMLFMYGFTGDAWAFKNVQIAWREGDHFPVFGVLWDFCTGSHEGEGQLRYMIIGWICVAAIIFYIWMFFAGLKTEAVFGLIMLLIPLTSHVMSTPRFIAGSFVMWMGWYLALQRLPRGLKFAFTVAGVAASVFLIGEWMGGSVAMI